MKIITLSDEQFNEFARKNKYKSFYQTPNYGRLMKTDGYDYHLLGFINNSNQLVGATMILYKKVLLNYKMAYAPFGFLIDYSNNDLVQEITNKLKLLLLKQKYIYLKINPKIECSKRNKDGEIITYNPEINDIMEILQKNNYIHTGFNSYFENLKPRWNAILKLTSSNDNLYKDLSKQIRNKISKAKRCGIETREATEDELKDFFEFIKRKYSKRDLKYYQRLVKEFGENAKVNLAILNTEKYLSKSKEAYEFEVNKNEFYNYKLQEAIKTGINVDKIMNQKMESDKIVATNQQHLIEATKIFSRYPKGIITAGMLTIDYYDDIYLIIEGYNDKYKDYDPNYLLKWEMIEKWNKEEKKSFNLNGIVGEFKNPNKYSGLNESKLGYNADAVEYIGEFDLVINKTVYNIYNRIKNKKKGK